jgi:hypothetical protein
VIRLVQISDNTPSINTQRTPSEAVFHSALEQFIFNADDLALIKVAITKLINGEITETQFKEHLLLARQSMLKKIVQFFTDKNNEHKEIINNLNLNIKEYKELLMNIVPRLEILEKKLMSATSYTCINSIKLGSELPLEQKLKQALVQINIELWLKAFPLNADKVKVRDDYQFIIRFFTALGKYHDKLFNIEKSQDISNITRIENLNFPLNLHDNLVKLLSVRNNLNHDFYTISSDDIDLAYISYFQLIFHLFKEAVGKKLIESNYEQIKNYIKLFIQNQINIDSYTVSIAFNELNKEF